VFVVGTRITKSQQRMTLYWPCSALLSLGTALCLAGAIHWHYHTRTDLLWANTNWYLVHVYWLISQYRTSRRPDWWCLRSAPVCSITWTLNDVSASPPHSQLFHSPRLNVPWSVCPRRTLVGF